MSLFVSVGECMVELAPEGAQWKIGIAGDTFNTAWYARALLPPAWTVAYLTSLGTDPYSAQALELMTANGIATDLVQRHPTRSIGLYAISLNEGERSFSYWRDTSAARTLADDAERLHGALEAADVIHVSGITLAILPPEGRRHLVAALAAARRRGAVTVLDPNYRARLWPDAATAAAAVTEAASAVSILLPSFDDEALVFGDVTPEATALRYAAQGAGTVVVKNGAGGLTLCAEGRVWRLGDLPQVAALDTTGAGDSFNAGFLAALLGGAGVEAAARAGHALAARVVTHPGALIPMEALR